MKAYRILTVFSIMLIGMTLFACSVETPEPENRTTVYRSEEIVLPDGFELSGDKLLYSAGLVIVDGVTDYPIDYPADDRQLFLEIDDVSGNMNVNYYESLGEAYTLITVHSDGGEKFVVRAVGAEFGYSEMYIEHYNIKEELIAKYDCSELFGVDISKMKMNVAGEGGFLIRYAGFDGDDLVAVSNTGIVRISADGTRSLIDSKHEITSAVMNDGRLIVIYTQNYKAVAAYVDFAAGKIGDKISFTGGGEIDIPFVLPGWELGAVCSDGIYGYTLPEANGEASGENVLTATLLCDFVKSDLIGTLRGICAVSDKIFYMTEINFITNITKLYRLEMVESENLTEKQTLKLAAITEWDFYLKNAIAEFNRTNNEYRIELYDYSIKDENGLFDMEATSTRFNADIASGDIPDIIMTAPDFGMNPENYASKGLFCDLYTLIDADSDFERDNILECVRESFEFKDKQSGGTILPYIPATCTVSTLIGDATTFDGAFTLTDAMDKLETLGDGRQMLEIFSNYKLLDFLSHSLEDFIDYKTGETFFKSEEFLRFAELYKNTEYKRLQGDKYDLLRNGNVLLYEMYNFSSFNFASARIRSGLDKLAVIGYPDTDGSGVLLEPKFLYSISSKCEAKEAAWEFIKIRISDEYLLSYGNYPIVTESAFEKYFAESYKYYYIGYSGGGGQSEKPINIENAKKTMGDGIAFEVDDEYTEFVRSVILSARVEPSINKDIMSIITEELSGLYNPAVTVAETAERIDKRVSILYNERN